jgi:hypothetical protein
MGLQTKRLPDAVYCRGRPTVLAMERKLHCVASAGMVSRVRRDFVIADRPRRARTRSVETPSTRPLAKRLRQRPTVCWLPIPSRSAMTGTALPLDQFERIAELSFVTESNDGFFTIHNAIAVTISETLQKEKRSR